MKSKELEELGKRVDLGRSLEDAIEEIHGSVELLKDCSKDEIKVTVRPPSNSTDDEWELVSSKTLGGERLHEVVRNYLQEALADLQARLAKL